MPYAPPVPDGNSSNPDQISYPTDRIREVAAKLLVQADLALQQHNWIWSNVQHYLETNDDNGHMMAVLAPHEKRMRDSYNWQQQLAQTLFSALDQVEAMDNQIQQSFTPTRNHGPAPS